jgi:hypothetical protein
MGKLSYARLISPTWQLFSVIAFLTYAGWNLQFSFRSETFSEANIV